MKNSDIRSYPFRRDHFNAIGEYNFGKNWPVVYIIEDGREIYIGETTDVFRRSKQHHENPERARLKNIHIITDEEYNKSAALDIESLLIQHIIADEKFLVQNGNSGLSEHNYFDREKYRAKFEILWHDLMKMDLVAKNLLEIRNSQIFKFSPYKNLTEDQLDIVLKVKDIFIENQSHAVVINGGPGTGKTILSTFLVKNLLEDKNFKDLKIGFVVPMTSLRSSLQKVFSHVKGLKSSMVIGPNEVTREKYDLLIVDESHRLRKRLNLPNFGAFDQTNRLLGFGNEGTELDWIMKSSRYQIFFYDSNQSVRPADISHAQIEKLNATHLHLKKQIRVKGGEEYIKFINDTLDLEPPECNFEDYDFRVFESIHEMVDAIKNKDKEVGLSRVVAGFAWPWATKSGTALFDIEIDGLKMIWNSVTNNWVNSKNSINEVGCIHTIQGYDLNYTGVIIGPEVSYDPVTHKIVIHREKYADVNGWRSVTDPEELKRYIINIYKTLLTRGIYGTYVYVVDENLRKYLIAASQDENYT